MGPFKIELKADGYNLKCVTVNSIERLTESVLTSVPVDRQKPWQLELLFAVAILF